MSEQRKAAVVYHAADFDGIGSGYLARRALRRDYDVVDAYGVDYGTEVPSALLTGQYDKIVVVDFSWPPVQLRNLAEVAQHVIWIDHHKTAIDAWAAAPCDRIDAVLDTKKAAIELTWEVFYPGERVPRLVQALAGWDIRRWDLIPEDEGAQIQYAMRVRSPTIEDAAVWDAYLEWDRLTWMTLRAQGATILEWLRKEDARRAQHVHFATWEGMRWAVQVGPAVPVEALWREVPGDYVGLIGVSYIDGAWVCSLRRVPNSTLDLSALAKKYGGGGHPGAAGFRLSELPRALFPTT